MIDTNNKNDNKNDIVKKNTFEDNAKDNARDNARDYSVEIWDSDSASENDAGGCNSFPDGNVMLGKNVALIKDDVEGVLRTDSFREYLESVKEFEDLRSMFICMILDLKERVKGCEHCETCSQVIKLVEVNIQMCKKVSKLAHGFANVFIYLVKGAIPDKLNENATHLLNVAFILLVKNSKFPDIQFIYEKFKAFINIDAFEGLALRLAIQKYKPADIRIMMKEWGCNITVRNHRPIIRAFHYEKFGVVRTLIELGSSYKYYLQEDLSSAEYQVFQKAIDKYLARQFPEATEIEKEFRIVEMINDFRHLMIAEDAGENNEESNDYNPISTDYFIEEFMEYFYEKTGTNPSEKIKNKKNKTKKKKNKNKKNKNKNMQIDISSILTEPTTYNDNDNDNEYDLMNDETFNQEYTNNQEATNNQKATNETILLDSYYSSKLTANLPYNQIHLENWKSSCAMEEYNYWDRHFKNVFAQYSY